MNKKLTKQEMADLIAAEKEHFSDPKNVPKKSKTLTVNMTKEEKEKYEKEQKLKDSIAAEKEYFSKKKNKRKKWDYMDPEIHKRAKGGMIKGYKHGGSVKAGRLAKRGYGAAKK